MLVKIVHRTVFGGCMARRNNHYISGVTLIEAMVVVAILAILSAIAAPNLRSFIGTIGAKSSASDLVNDLMFARSEAIKRNQAVAIKPVNGSWAAGWQVEIPGAMVPVLTTHDALKSSLSISGAPTVGITFQTNGRLAADTAPDNLKWTLSSTEPGITPRCIVITATGSARAKSGACP